LWLNPTWATLSPERKILNIKKTNGEIRIDGVLDEEDWKNLETANNFQQHFPYDTLLAKSQTEVMITYNDKYLYIAAICYGQKKGEYVVQSLKRDYDFNWSDGFAVNIDPFGDENNAFNFGVSPFEVQREALITNGGVWGGDASWDNKWFSAVSTLKDSWIVEMAIPFKTLRYNDEDDVWRINFLRNDVYNREDSHWSPVPRNYNENFLGFSGELHWDNPPPSAGTNISIIPYTIGQISRDFENGEAPKLKPNIGMDGKIAVTTSLNLDLTINPDFSQVDADKQVSNLTRFSLFVPEKRKFFLENSDLFGSFGFRQIRPFFSRRIGLYPVSDFQNELVPILSGARLSGKLTRNISLGVLNAQTGRVEDLDIESQNYSTVVMRRHLGGKSYLGAIFVNRQAFPLDSVAFAEGKRSYNYDNNDYNRIVGADYFYSSKSNKWAGKIFYHHSLSPGLKDKTYAHASFLIYNSKKIFSMWNHEYVGYNYTADVGYVPRIYHYDPETETVQRRSYWRFEPHFTYKFYPKSGIINHHSVGVFFDHYMDENMEYMDRQNKLKYEIKFQSASDLKFSIVNDFSRLIYPSDLNGTFDTLLPVGSYSYNYGSIEYVASQRNRLNSLFKVNYGSFFNGTKLSISGALNYRVQPWGKFSINASRDNIIMPAPYNNAYVTVIGPQIQLSFTKSLFFTTFIQYNNQINNVNINSRFQWRFKPMSDLFIVYSDNYYTTSGFTVRNRGLVVKFIYWFSI